MRYRLLGPSGLSVVWFVLATKYTASQNPADPNAAGNHPKNLVLALETSLRRLRIVVK
jgi:aryl-alcohol dehydrogenase-like predicted oxidoreductase